MYNKKECCQIENTGFNDVKMTFINADLSRLEVTRFLVMSGYRNGTQFS